MKRIKKTYSGIDFLTKKRTQATEMNTSVACARDEICIAKHFSVPYMYYRISDRVSRKVTLYKNIFLDENGDATYREHSIGDTVIFIGDINNNVPDNTKSNAYRGHLSGIPFFAIGDIPDKQS